MPLCEREQRALREIEQALVAGSPRLDRRLRRCGAYRRARRLLLRVLVLVTGVAIFAAGCGLSGTAGLWVSVAGYLLIAASIASALPVL